MPKIFKKILSIFLMASVGANSIFRPPGNGSPYIIIGTPKQVVQKFKDVNTMQQIIPNSYINKIDNRENLVELAKIQVQLPITFEVPFNFSEKFDNKEGPALQEKDLTNDIFNRVHSSFNKSLINTKNQFANDLGRKYKIRLSESEIDAIFFRALELTSFSVSGTVEGYACPMGGNPRSNLALSQSRAEQARKLLQNGISNYLQSFFRQSAGIANFSNLKAVGMGSIYDDPRVENLTSLLNKYGYSLNSALIKSGDARELAKFDDAMKRLKMTKNNVYQSYERYLSPLRKAVFRITLQFSATVFGEEIEIRESVDYVDAVMPTADWINVVQGAGSHIAEGIVRDIKSKKEVQMENYAKQNYTSRKSLLKPSVPRGQPHRTSRLGRGSHKGGRGAFGVK